MATRLIISRPGVPVEERVFDDEIVTIGSDPGATLHLADPSIAPEQAIVIREDGRPLLINRAPGTLFNGEPLAREARHTLAAGDRIEFGPYGVAVAAVEGEPEEAARYAVRYEDTSHARADERDAADSRGVEGGAPGDRGDAQSSRQQQQPQGRSFAAILDSLRTEEDSFYFVVESSTGRRRVRLEAAETMIGWDETGRRISCDAGVVVAARAVVRKDWSGVVALPLSPGLILVNGETVEAPRRLRDGDRVTLLRVSAHEPEDSCLVFHEPASLVVLDTLLPQQQTPALPARAAAETAGAAEASSLVRQPPAAVEAKTGFASPERRYFGYFTPTEVLVMVVGTLVTAAIIFIILELYA